MGKIAAINESSAAMPMLGVARTFAKRLASNIIKS